MSIGSLSSAASGLFAHRRRLDVISHNVANASTEGYSKQRTDLVTESSSAIGIWSGSSTSLGGVSVAGISRSRDAFLEMRSLSLAADASELQASAQYHNQIESTLAEPSDLGIAAAIDSMWSAFDDFANYPDQIPQRTALLNSAAILTDRFNEVDTNIRSVHLSAVNEAQSLAVTINDLASEVATLNKAVASAGPSTNVNDLLDQRDLAISSLAELAGVRTVDREDGSIDVYIGNSTLVQSSKTFEVTTSSVADPSLATLGLSRLDVSVAGARITSVSGQLGGVVQSANVTIPGSLTALNDVAAALISDVNALHTTAEDLDGNPGVPFFTGSSAGDIAVSAALTADPRKLAAAAPGAGSRDGSLALQVADLRNSSSGADARYESFVVTLGLSTSAVARRSSAASEASAKVDEARLGARSVSLDEEMIDLVEAQRAYEASARVVNAIDEMLETLVNRLGTVGR